MDNKCSSNKSCFIIIIIIAYLTSMNGRNIPTSWVYLGSNAILDVTIWCCTHLRGTHHKYELPRLRRLSHSTQGIHRIHRSRNSTQSCVSVCVHVRLCTFSWGGRSGPLPSWVSKPLIPSREAHHCLRASRDRCKAPSTSPSALTNFWDRAYNENSRAAAASSQFFELARYYESVQDTPPGG